MSRPESILSALLLLTFAALPAAAQRPSVPMPDEPVPFDDAFGRALDFDTSAVRPIAFSQDEQRLYVINSSGARLASFDVATFTRVGEIAIGLGAASVVRRPGTDELWVVDRVGSCVDIVDPALGAIVRTIRVGAEPHSLVFDPSGTRAWVTCSAQERVDVVRTSDYSVVRSLRIQAEDRAASRSRTARRGAFLCSPATTRRRAARSPIRTTCARSSASSVRDSCRSPIATSSACSPARNRRSIGSTRVRRRPGSARSCSTSSPGRARTSSGSRTRTP